MRVFEGEYKGVEESLVEGVKKSQPMEFLGVVLVDSFKGVMGSQNLYQCIGVASNISA